MCKAWIPDELDSSLSELLFLNASVYFSRTKYVNHIVPAESHCQLLHESTYNADPNINPEAGEA